MMVIGKKMWYISVQNYQYCYPKKYFGLAEDELKKQRYYNHTQTFRNENYSNSTNLPSYVWKIKKTRKKTQTLVWEIIRTAAPYTNITKRCSLCLYYKLAILTYLNQSEHLNKRSEQVSKWQPGNKFLLQTCNCNDWSKYLYSLASIN